jgi:hypothetical protein
VKRNIILTQFYDFISLLCLDRVNHLHGSEMCFSHCSSRTDGYDLRSERHECGERIGEHLQIED